MKPTKLFVLSALGALCLTPPANAFVIFNVTKSQSIFNANFENGTVGSVPGANDPLVGNWSNNGLSNSLAVVAAATNRLGAAISATEGSKFLRLARTPGSPTITAVGEFGAATNSGTGDLVRISFSIYVDTNGAAAFPMSGAADSGEIDFLANGSISIYDGSIPGPQVLTQTYNLLAWNTVVLQHTNGSGSWSVSVNGTTFETRNSQSSYGGTGGNATGIRLETSGAGSTVYYDAIPFVPEVLFADNFESNTVGAVPSAPQFGSYMETTNLTRVVNDLSPGAHGGANYLITRRLDSATSSSYIVRPQFTRAVTEAGNRLHVENWFYNKSGSTPPFAEIGFVITPITAGNLIANVMGINGTSVRVSPENATFVDKGQTLALNTWHKWAFDYVMGTTNLTLTLNDDPSTTTNYATPRITTSIIGLFFKNGSQPATNYVDDVQAYLLPGVKTLLVSTQPADGATGVSRTTNVVFTVKDGTQKVNTNSLVLYFNGVPVLPSITRPSGTNLTIISYQPPIQPEEATNTVQLVYSDDALPGNVNSNTITYTIISTLNTRPPLQESADGLLVIEAERFDRNVLPNVLAQRWTGTNSDPGYSGEGAMQAVPNTGVNVGDDVSDSPRLDYKVRFFTTGTHYIWVRGRDNGTVGTTDNGVVHAGLDKVLLSTTRRIGRFPAGAGWVWLNTNLDGTPVAFDVTSPGDHQFHIWMREDGFIIDKILITTNASYPQPTGAGPGENFRANNIPSYSAVLFSDNLENAAVGSAPNAPQAGSYNVETNPAVVTNNLAPGAHGGSNYLVIQRVTAATVRIARPAFFAPLSNGSVHVEAWINLPIGSGIAEMGLDTAGDSFHTDAAFGQDGKVRVWDGTTFVDKGLTNALGVWTKLALDYVVGSTNIVLTVNNTPAAFSVPAQTVVKGLWFRNGADGGVSYVDDISAVVSPLLFADTFENSIPNTAPDAPQIGSYNIYPPLPFLTITTDNPDPGAHGGLKYLISERPNSATASQRIAHPAFTASVTNGTLHYEAWIYHFVGGFSQMGLDTTSPSADTFAQIISIGITQLTVTVFNGTAHIAKGVTVPANTWVKLEADYVVGSTNVLVAANGVSTNYACPVRTVIKGLSFKNGNNTGLDYVDDVQAWGPISAPQPKITTVLAGGQLTLSWSGAGFRLQQSDDVSNPSGWTDVPLNSNATPVTSPYTVTVGAGKKFYRLIYAFTLP